jgi:DNA-binding NarL/FixJ family response regulator
MTIRIFLADDHPVVRNGLRLILGTQGDITIVGEASDGRDAVDRVLRLKPDVVIMDIAMPVLNGIEATQQILEAVPEVKVIILSMHSSTEHVSGVLKAGALGYLLKESAGKDIVHAIRTVYSGHRYLCQKVSESLIGDCIGLGGATRGRSALNLLSPREREVLHLVTGGKTSKEIGLMLSLSPKTVETYRSRLMVKLGIKDIPNLVKFAIEYGITSL